MEGPDWQNKDKEMETVSAFSLQAGCHPSIGKRLRKHSIDHVGLDGVVPQVQLQDIPSHRL
jgi:hypothetical protein